MKQAPFIFNVMWAVQAGLILLKCIDKINWHWVQVFIPFEIYVALILLYAFVHVLREQAKREQKKLDKTLETIRNANIDDLK